MSKPKGTLHHGSIQHQLAELPKGEVAWFETTLEQRAAHQRALAVPRSRRTDEMKKRPFATTVFTAVSASKVGEIRYLIRVERVL